MPSSLRKCPSRVVRSLDWCEPEAAFARLRRHRYPVWLDSGGPAGPRARYSYLCVDPVEVLEKRDGRLSLDGILLAGGGFSALARMVRHRYRSVDSGPVPFTGGAVGLLGYGLARELERLPTIHPEDPDLPELWIATYDLVLAFDHATSKIWLISAGFHSASGPEERADWLQRLLHTPAPEPGLATMPTLSFLPDRLPGPYTQMVRNGLGLIAAGDIFQANLTTRHVAIRPDRLEPADVHLALRRVNPAAFGAFLAWDDGRALVSASPERFIRLEPDGTIETRPIKGTARRCFKTADDADAMRDLARSVKDRAENLMIVDLMRNDLARVASLGSVDVPVLFEIESVATLHHLVSTVTARLRDGEDAVSLLQATFPGGSVTGAPKIRAMEIIDALEASSRGPYCGCLVWIGENGSMDSSIVIRSLMLTRQYVIAHAGGGIVADSDPEAEHCEMMAKVAPLLSVFQ